MFFEACRPWPARGEGVRLSRSIFAGPRVGARAISRPDIAGLRRILRDIASTERSAASLNRMGRANEAAGLRRTAAKLRQQTGGE